MNDTAITWSRRLYDRLRGWGGLILYLTIGAVASGVSTAGAGPICRTPQGRRGIEGGVRGRLQVREVREWTWNGEPFLEHVWAPPPTTMPPSAGYCPPDPQARPLRADWNQRPERELPMRSPTMLNVRTPSIVALAALVAMLGAHIVLRTEDDLSPWKGAGFAMFSTVDSPGMRTVAVWADVAGVEERVASSGGGTTPAAVAGLADRCPDGGPRQWRGFHATRASRRREPGPARPPGGGRAGADRRCFGPDHRGSAPARRRWAVVEVRRVRVDVTKLSYDDGIVLATLLRSASADVVGGD